MPGFELFGAAERQHVQDVLDTGILMRYGFDGLRNGIWKAKEFEWSFAQRMGVDHCQLVSSGTAALTVALAAAGIGAGDEVIMPTFTFVASFESIIALGAIPVLVDIDDTLCLDPKAVEAAITDNTKCVMPVHMCGAMADLEALKSICDAKGLLLLEDACQAIGGTYQGKALGAYGDLGCFSFDFVKTITCGEGGGVITNNANYARRADHFQDHGHDHIGNDRGAEGHPFLGYNYRISELQAAVGLGQLSQFDDILALQKRNFRIIAEALADLPNVRPRRIPKGAMGNHSFINFFMDTQQQAAQGQAALAEAGIDACFYWYTNNWHYIRGWAHLKSATAAGPLSEAIKKELLSLETRDFSKSDFWMSRNLSCLVKLSWTEEEVRKRAATMRRVLSSL